MGAKPRARLVSDGGDMPAPASAGGASAGGAAVTGSATPGTIDAGGSTSRPRLYGVMGGREGVGAPPLPNRTPAEERAA